MTTTDKLQTLEELLREFDKRFPCLVKPVGYTFDRYGKKEEVEGMTYEKDRVLSFIKKVFEAGGEAVKQEIKINVDDCYDPFLKTWDYDLIAENILKFYDTNLTEKSK